MPTGGSPAVDRMQEEYERLRRRQEMRAEFLHAQQTHEELAEYEKRKQRAQADRYKRAIWRMNNPISRGIFTEIFNAQSVPSRVMRNTHGGEYGRINETFVVELDNQDMVSYMENYINTSGYDRLERQSSYIRGQYVHDTSNTGRNVDMCRSYSYWSIHSIRRDIATFMGDPVRLICLGCGIDGGLSI